MSGRRSAPKRRRAAGRSITARAPRRSLRLGAQRRERRRRVRRAALAERPDGRHDEPVARRERAPRLVAREGERVRHVEAQLERRLGVAPGDSGRAREVARGGGAAAVLLLSLSRGVCGGGERA